VDEVNRLIRIKDCTSAESYAKIILLTPVLYTALGMVNLDCIGDRATAISYFQMGAREREIISMDMLASLNATSIGPSLGNFPVPFNQLSPPQPIYSETFNYAPAPPVHTYTPLVVTRPQTQQLIILQRPIYAPIFNSAACIQDGGGTFCPYYRR
jgi:hypothetical protein